MRGKTPAVNDTEIISSSKTPLFTLAGRLHPKRAQAFLVELLNLPALNPPLQAVDLPVLTRFARRLPDFCFEGTVPLAIREEIENAWRQPTTFDRESALLSALESSLFIYSRESEAKSADAATWANIWAAIWHAQKFADLMRVCPNPECPARYFVAGKRSQKYCSKACAAPAQRELKRTWWSKKGPAWRAKWRAEHNPKRKVKPSRKKSQRKRGKRI